MISGREKKWIILYLFMLVGFILILPDVRVVGIIINIVILILLYSILSMDYICERGMATVIFKILAIVLFILLIIGYDLLSDLIVILGALALLVIMFWLTELFNNS